MDDATGGSAKVLGRKIAVPCGEACLFNDDRVGNMYRSLAGCTELAPLQGEMEPEVLHMTWS